MFYGVLLEASDKLNLSDFEQVTLTKEYIDKYNIKGIQPNDKTHKSIGWERVKGVLVAKVDVYHDPKNKDFGERHCINNLEVDKRYRNKGLGTQVLDYAVKHMNGDFIIVEAKNKIAFEMYKKYGFKVGSDTEKTNGKIKYYQMYLKFPKGITALQETAKITSLDRLKEIVKSIKAEVDKYKKGGKAGNQNCMLCTWCVELQCRGRKDLPRPVYSPRDVIFDLEGYEFLTNKSKISIKNKQNVIDTVLKAGEGSRFYCHVNWQGSSGGHEFILTCIDNKVYIVDGQAGSVRELKVDKKDSYFDNINYNNSFLLRSDTSGLNNNILKYNDKEYITEWDDEEDPKFLENELGQKE